MSGGQSRNVQSNDTGIRPWRCISLRVLARVTSQSAMVRHISCEREPCLVVGGERGEREERERGGKLLLAHHVFSAHRCEVLHSSLCFSRLLSYIFGF